MGGQLYLAINYLLSLAKNGQIPPPKVLLKINTEKDTVRGTGKNLSGQKCYTGLNK